MNKNKILMVAANEFTEKIRKLSTPLEVAIVGSVAGNDTHPSDLDLVVILRNLNEIASIAKYARQIGRHYHAWEVFIFDESLSYLGRICHRRECPGDSVDCCVAGCGNPPHLRVRVDFKYNEEEFLTSPIVVLWTSLKKSLLLTCKEELGIFESREYAVLEDVEIECTLCGKAFVFTGGEQKWYQKQGFSQPRRCPNCIEGHIICEEYET